NSEVEEHKAFYSFHSGKRELMGSETARVHHAYRWRHGNVAHEDVRATDGQASYYWISWCECFGLCSVGGCFCGPPARTRLGRGPYHRNRVSLVRRPSRALRRDCG